MMGKREPEESKPLGQWEACCIASNTCWHDGFTCRSEDMAERHCGHAHEEDNCHQSEEGD